MQVVYQSEHEIDLTSLGDDDVVLVDQPTEALFSGIRSEVSQLTLGTIEARDGGREVLVTYHLSRPVGGWSGFGKEPILSTVSGSVTDAGDSQLARQDLAVQMIEVLPSRALSGRLLGFPELASPLETSTEVTMRL